MESKKRNPLLSVNASKFFEDLIEFIYLINQLETSKIEESYDKMKEEDRKKLSNIKDQSFILLASEMSELKELMGKIQNKRSDYISHASIAKEYLKIDDDSPRPFYHDAKDPLLMAMIQASVNFEARNSQFLMDLEQRKFYIPQHFKNIKVLIDRAKLTKEEFKRMIVLMINEFVKEKEKTKACLLAKLIHNFFVSVPACIMLLFEKFENSFDVITLKDPHFSKALEIFNALLDKNLMISERLYSTYHFFDIPQGDLKDLDSGLLKTNLQPGQKETVKNHVKKLIPDKIYSFPLNLDSMKGSDELRECNAQTDYFGDILFDIGFIWNKESSILVMRIFLVLIHELAHKKKYLHQNASVYTAPLSKDDQIKFFGCYGVCSGDLAEISIFGFKLDYEKLEKNECMQMLNPDDWNDAKWEAFLEKLRVTEEHSPQTKEGGEKFSTHPKLKKRHISLWEEMLGPITPFK